MVTFKQSLLFFKKVGTLLKVYLLDGVSCGEFKVKSFKCLGTNKRHFALANYKDRRVYLSGGEGDRLAKVYYLDAVRDMRN